MKLEMKKYRLKGFVIGALITMVGMFGMVLLIIATTISEGAQPFNDIYELIELINTLVNDAYLIFAAVMLSKFVIGEYSDGTINLLFSYPIRRKKLISAKIILVATFMIITMVIANTAILSGFYALNLIYEVYPVVLTLEFLAFIISKVLLYSVAFAAIGSLSLYIGMIKKSQAATIVSSIIVVSIIGSSSNGFSLSAIVIIPVTIGLIGIFMTYLTFRNVEKVDI